MQELLDCAEPILPSWLQVQNLDMHILSTEKYVPSALRQQYLRVTTAGRADAKLHNNRVHIALECSGEPD